ncbi:hypothetical protein [Gracilimonas mengyeensis]|uniref:Uncharacterized protein n=1 Tax=Gracilimonas mengyeensis TaxID=1302730 RepID=A0A521FMZ7_9BACT|nr:hypothetical protein [Gracilimonas mengyeensis]SMO96950.1 hypothetical protein SAMN06265219_1226 [Gracilimonas mengyeensis]
MPIQYIAVLDREHLDNSVFLTAFAKSLAQHGSRKGIIVHSDSPYTDRLIQTGMMREDARLRAIKDLNRRLVGLFADQGISTIGVHGYQKGLIKKEAGTVQLSKEVLNELHDSPHLLVSSLVEQDDEVVHVPLPEVVKVLSRSLDEPDVLLFSRKEKDEIILSDNNKEYRWEDLPTRFEEETLPEEFQNFDFPVHVTTATAFAQWPNLKKVTKISP